MAADLWTVLVDDASAHVGLTFRVIDPSDGSVIYEGPLPGGRLLPSSVLATSVPDSDGSARAALDLLAVRREFPEVEVHVSLPGRTVPDVYDAALIDRLVFADAVDAPDDTAGSVIWVRPEDVDATPVPSLLDASGDELWERFCSANPTSPVRGHARRVR